MKDFIKIIERESFSLEIEKELKSKINENTTEEDFLNLIKNINVYFNSCYNCGIDLSKNDYGYMILYGICEECSFLID